MGDDVFMVIYIYVNELMGIFMEIVIIEENVLF